MPSSCALLGGFAIGARVALLWHHNANAKCYRLYACTRSMPSLYVVVVRGFMVIAWVCLAVLLLTTVDAS